MYITTHVHDIVIYIPTNCLLELYPVGMQFDKEHSTGSQSFSEYDIFHEKKVSLCICYIYNIVSFLPDESGYVRDIVIYITE